MPPYSAHFWFFRIEQSRVRYMGIQYFPLLSSEGWIKYFFARAFRKSIVFQILGKIPPYPHSVSAVLTFVLY